MIRVCVMEWGQAGFQFKGGVDRAPWLAPLCAIPSGCCSFTGPWTVTRSSLRMLRWVAAFLSAAAAGAPAGVVSAFAEPRRWCVGGCAECGGMCPFARQRRPIVGVLRMCWLLRGFFDCFLLSTRLCPQAVHSLPRCVSVCVRPRCPVPPGVVPAVHHMSFSPSRLVCP